MSLTAAAHGSENRGMAVSVETDYDAFRRELPDLLADPQNHDLFALVGGGRVVGLYPTFDAAADAGYKRFGLDPFLVQPVVEKERPKYFTGRAVPWR